MKPTNQHSAEFSPLFKDIHSRLYGAEYAAASIAIVYYVGWRTFNGGGVDRLQVVFWAIFPDLGGFVPIAITSERRV